MGKLSDNKAKKSNSSALLIKPLALKDKIKPQPLPQRKQS